MGRFVGGHGGHAVHMLGVEADAFGFRVGDEQAGLAAALAVNRMRHADTYKAAPREEDRSAQGSLL